MKLLSALVLLAAASSGVQAVNSADALRALIRGREAARLTPQGVNGPSSAASLTVSPAPLLTPVYDLGADGCVHPACPSAGGAAPSTVSPALGSAAVEADDITIRSAEESSSEASGAATGSLQAVINSYTADIKQNLAKLQGESTGPSAAAVQAVAAESSALAAKVAQAVAAAKSEESSEASAALAKAASEASGLASEASQAAAKAEASAAAAAAESAAVLSRLTAVEGQVAQLRARVDAIPARAEESSAAPAPAPAPVAPAPRSEESSGLLPSRSEELSSPQVSVSEVSRAAADQLRDELKAEVRREVRAEVKAEAAQLVQKTTEVILMEAGTPPQQAKEKARKAVEEAQALIDARQQEESSREVVAESSESSQSPEQKLATLVAKKVEDELAGKVAQIASAVAKHEAESVVSEGSESSRQRSEESSSSSPSRSEESSEESSESAAAILAKAARFAETRERVAVKTASTKVLAAALGIERPALGAKSLTDLDIDKLVEGNGVTHRELDATLRAARNNARFQELGLGANAGDDLDVPLDESL